MKAGSHCTPEAYLEASSSAQLVQIEVSPTHPLLVLKRALPWEAITEAMTRHWREHGKNVDGGVPGVIAGKFTVTAPELTDRHLSEEVDITRALL